MTVAGYSTKRWYLLGLAFTFAQPGSFISPPLGNSLANLNPGLPFLFWASLSVMAIIPLLLLRIPDKKYN